MLFFRLYIANLAYHSERIANLQLVSPFKSASLHNAAQALFADPIPLDLAVFVALVAMANTV